ncbi:L7Ae/L30e/S12e/Gadd45 family ribosomal protein [Salinicoccus hispanicus]
MMDKILNLLGLAKRAGMLTTGEDKTIEAIQHKRAKVVFIASDAGDSTAKKVRNKCNYYNVPLIDDYTNENLSIATGAPNRVVLSVTDTGFSRKMLQLKEKGK